ncbi:hypothetical protein [Corynebacterium lubricantis]|uniref:hypothetical protein n=1 Tax=Corynebacterium lubricantis TaxID=541095 RepID=UPI000369E9B3|nr:hypothetical protein [Corynebacterium lubricantis]
MSNKSEATWHPLKTPQEILDWAESEKEKQGWHMDDAGAREDWKRGYFHAGQGDALERLIKFATGEPVEPTRDCRVNDFITGEEDG